MTYLKKGEKMNRPEVICHMVSTIDGKSQDSPLAPKDLGPYLQTKQKFGAQATAYGASTAKEIFVGRDKENFKGAYESDYICGKEAPYFTLSY